jgi:long-chain acyl-CoA synthetase
VDAGAAPARSRTIPALWRDAVASGREGPAYLVEHSDHWHPVSWPEAARRVDELANGLLALGLRKGDTFVILGNTRLEWSLFDFALASVGGVGAPIYMNSSPKDAQHVAEHSEAVGALVEDDVQRAKLDGLALRHVLTYADLDDLAARGRAFAAENPGALDAAVAAIDEDDLFTYIYTSGTTGPPKGVMETHASVCWMAATSNASLGGRGGQRHISYLPFAHIFERFVGHWGAIHFGNIVYFCPDPLLLFAYAVEVKPTAIIGVPRVWEKLQAGLMAGIQADPDEQRRSAVLGAIEVGRKLVKLEQARQQPPPELLAAAEKCRPVWMALRAKVGLDQLEWGITGAAPINPDVIEFFQALGIKLWEGWGMTETAVGATYNPLERIKNGTVGIADPGVELKIADDGEILVRGGNVTRGYYKDPQMTAQTIDAEGWLHTGDVGELDDEGYLRIVDRKKELIITAGGKNISPANLEALLKQNPVIGQAAVIGDRRPYLSALVVLDPEVAPVWARKAGIAFTTIAGLAEHPAMHEEVQKAVDEANRHVSQVEGIKRFTILPVEWTAESEELTPTLKMKRRVVSQKYAREIEEMYSRDEPRRERVESEVSR